MVWGILWCRRIAFHVQAKEPAIGISQTPTNSMIEIRNLSDQNHMIACGVAIKGFAGKSRDGMRQHGHAVFVWGPVHLGKAVTFVACKYVRDVLLILGQDVDAEMCACLKGVKA